MRFAWWYYVPHLLLGAGALFLAYHLRLVLAPFAIAYLLAAMLDPLVDRMQRRGWKRGHAVGYIFAVVLLLFVILLQVGLPVAVSQIRQFADNVPHYVEEAGKLQATSRERLSRIGIPPYIQDAARQHASGVAGAVAQRVGTWVQGIIGSFGFLLWLVLIPVATFYLLNDIDRIRAKALLFVPARYREAARTMAHDIASVFVSYLRGLTTVSVLFGIAILVVLLALRAPYAVALALMAAVLYPVPYIGPLITVFTILLVTGFAAGWGRGATGAVLAVVANQGFDQLLTPRIVGKSVGLHPVLSMTALLIGADLFGLVGMLIAVPVAGAIQVVVLRLLPWLRAEEAVEESASPKEAPDDALGKIAPGRKLRDRRPPKPR